MTHTASHIIINVVRNGDSLTGTGTDEISLTYTPPAHLKPKQIGQEVAKRIKWLDTLAHADAADT